MQPAAIGFRAKTGRAIAVVLAGTGKVPALVWSGEVSLVDPSLPATAEPYHAVMEMPWNEATIAVQPLIEAIETRASAMLRELVDAMRAKKIHIRAVGVVGSPPRSIDRLGNVHIRAHAAEGILFRQVLESAAKANKLRCAAFSDRELVPSPLMKKMGRVDVRLAATAAYKALSE